MKINWKKKKLKNYNQFERRVSAPSRDYRRSPPHLQGRRVPPPSRGHIRSPSPSIRRTKSIKGGTKPYKSRQLRISGKKKAIIGVTFLMIVILGVFGILFIFNLNNEGEWKFIVYGDTRSNDSRHRSVLRSIEENTPDYEFILNVGDVVENGNDGSQWNTWKAAVDDELGGDILNTVGQNNNPPKYMAAPGNHDNTDDGAGLSNWNTYLPGQKNKFGNNGLFFVFDFKNARFIILNSESSITGPQLSMMQNAIDSNTKTWLFTVWHKPIFDFGQKSYEDGIHDNWGIPLFEGGCDIMFMGHAHYYVRTKKLGLNGNLNPPLDPIKGTVQVVTGDGGQGASPVDTNNDGNGYMLDGNSYYEGYGYTELKVVGNQLHLQHISDSGNVVDTETYTANGKFKASQTLNNFSPDTNSSLLITEMTPAKYIHADRQRYSKMDDNYNNNIFTNERFRVREVLNKKR